MDVGLIWAALLGYEAFVFDVAPDLVPKRWQGQTHSRVLGT